MLDRITIPVAVNGDPQGAEVRVKGYATPDASWELVGVAPFTIRFPYEEPPPEPLLAPITPEAAYEMPLPVSDDVFGFLRGLYVYERSSLEATLERVDDGWPRYRRETVSIRTAYGTDRMEVHPLFPRDVEPPYQAVLWFPGADAFLLPSSAALASAYLFDFIPESGRVLVHPVYSGMYSAAVSCRCRSGRRCTRPSSRRGRACRR